MRKYDFIVTVCNNNLQSGLKLDMYGINEISGASRQIEKMLSAYVNGTQFAIIIYYNAVSYTCDIYDLMF